MTATAKLPRSREAPHDRQAERAVLGALLRDPSCAARIAQIVGPSDYWIAQHAVIARAIDRALADRGTADPVLVGDALRARGELDAAGGAPELWALADECVTASGVEHHAEIVREHARRRRLQDVGRRLLLAAEDGTDSDSMRELLATAIEHENRRPGVGARSHSISDVLTKWRTDGPLLHVPTGIGGLDQMTGGGLVVGTATIAMGPPDSAKTLLVAHLVGELARTGVTVGVLAVDEDEDGLVTRLAQRAGFERRACETRDHSMLDRIGEAIGDLPVLVFDESNTIDTAAAELATVAKKRGTRAALFVDSLQTCRCAAETLGGSRYDATTTRMATLRACAARHRLIVVCTSEQNRASYRGAERDRTLSEMSAGKDSGAIEYLAKVLLSLRSIDNDAVELRLVKNKFGRRHLANEPGIRLAIDRVAQLLTESGSAPTAMRPQKDKYAELEATRRAVVATVDRMGGFVSSRRTIVENTRGKDKVLYEAIKEAVLAGDLLPDGSGFRRPGAAREVLPAVLPPYGRRAAPAAGSNHPPAAAQAAAGSNGQHGQQCGTTDDIDAGLPEQPGGRRSRRIP